MEKLTVNEFIASRMVTEKNIIIKAIDKLKDDNIRKFQISLMLANGQIADKEPSSDINFEFH